MPSQEVIHIGLRRQGRNKAIPPLTARLVGLPNGRVTADGSPGRTDDGRVVRDFKLEPTTREV